MSKKKLKPSKFSKWLEKLQQESWQLELLISGFAIFALFECRIYLKTLYPVIIGYMDTDAGSGSILLFSLLTIEISVYIFLVNLIIHISIRSLWIGAIGLRYVSADIDYKALSYNPRFEKYYQKRIGGFDNYIEKLENFSSILFSYTFLLFFILLSTLLYFILFILFIYVAREFFSRDAWINKMILRPLALLYLALGLIVAFDFLTLGLLKRVKNKYFSAFYLLIYRFYSRITLSFLWRPMLLNFLDQRYTRRLLKLTIPYLFLLGTISSFTVVTNGFYPDLYNQSSIKFPSLINSQSFNPSYYEEDRNHYPKNSYEQSIKTFSVPSKRFIGSLGEIFIKASLGDKFLITKMDSTLIPFEQEGLRHEIFFELSAGIEGGHNESERNDLINSLKKQSKNDADWKQKRDSLLLTFEHVDKEKYQQDLLKIKSILHSSILLSIDDYQISPEKISCDFYIHPHNKTKGVLCFFPLDSLSIGRHLLKVGRVEGVKDNKFKDSAPIFIDTTYQTIPFIYEGL